MGEEGGGADPNPNYNYDQLGEVLRGDEPGESSSDGEDEDRAADDASEPSDISDMPDEAADDDSPGDRSADDDDEGAVMERALVDTSDDDDDDDDDDDSLQADARGTEGDSSDPGGRHRARLPTLPACEEA